MKNVLLSFYVLMAAPLSLFADSPKEMIRAFVEAQPHPVTAYDIAAHFNASMTDPTFGSPNVFNTANTTNISVAALDATHFVVAYKDGGNGNQGTAIVGLVSGTSISSYGAENVFNAVETARISAAALDATSFVVVYYKGVFDPFASGCTTPTCTFVSIIGDVSGTTISGYGNEVEVDNSSGESFSSPSVANIGSFVVAYADIGSANNGTGIVASTTALPVELVWFRAEQAEAKVQLSWQTASEFNNEGFEIQRAANPDEWESIGFVEGDGFSVTLNNYSFTDPAPLRSFNYYRLKQIDFDGAFEYSDVVVIDFKNAGESTDLHIFPNPVANGVLHVDFPEKEGNRLRIYDGQGRLRLETAQNSETLSVAHLPAGLYILEVNTGKEVVRERFFKN